MDFYWIRAKHKNGVTDIYPDFKIRHFNDLMVRGKSFYAIWDQEAGLWSTDEFDVQRLVDEDLNRYLGSHKFDGPTNVLGLENFSSKSWLTFQSYLSKMPDSFHLLDQRITFANSVVKKMIILVRG